jgi:hypothetical protein
MHAPQANDIAMLADMARYMQNDYSTVAPYTAASFPHSNMPSLFWWDWNANSGDTGGIVENDWVTVRALSLAQARSGPVMYSPTHQSATWTCCTTAYLLPVPL